MFQSPQHNLSNFYQKVIQEFGNRLLYRYNQKEQGFDSEIIDQIKTVIFLYLGKKVKSKIAKQEELFCKALQIKHRSNSNQLVVQITKGSNIDNTVKKEEPMQSIQNHAQQQIDYANAFVVEAQIKKEQQQEQGIIKHEPNEDAEDEKDEEDERQKREGIEKLKNNLCMHIVGTYQPRNKKHIAKDQSTKLELQNVFIKHKTKFAELYVPKIICEFKKE